MERLKGLMMTPSLYWGGAEQWLYYIFINSRDCIDWKSIVLEYETQFNDKSMCYKFGKYIPIGCYGSKILADLLDDVDFVLCWGDVSIEEAARRNVSVIWCAHGCGKYDRSAYLKVRPYNPILTAVSEACLSIFNTDDRNKVTIIHNGIDLDRCKVTMPAETIREKFGITPGKFVVGYLGRIVPEKNLITLAQGIVKLPKNFVGMFVGDGYDFQNQYRQIKKILGDRAIFTGRVDDVGNYLNAFDLFVLTSLREGFSMAMLEAMATKKPCLLTNVGVLPYLKNKFGAFWFELDNPPSPHEIASKILEIYKIPLSELNEWCEKAFDIIVNNFSVKSMVANWVNFIYKSVRRK